MNAIEFNSVWKKFKKGEKFNSLRDSIPAFFRKLSQRNGNGQLAEQEFWAVKDVSFAIEKGGVVGIMGPNGAGKSTILKLLSRIIVPNKGTMKINGRLSALIEVTAGFHPELTGRENVYLNGTILGMKKREIDAKFDQIVEFSGIAEFIDTPVKRYSSGMYSRLGFSVAAHMDPDVLLVDEVLAVGDISFQSKCAQKMRELLHSGATIVLVSHNLSLIQSLCRRVILLNRGEAIKDGPTDEVIPYYENLVIKKQGEEFKARLSADDYKVKIGLHKQLSIQRISLKGEAGQPKENFRFGEAISLDIAYDAKEQIEQPVFCIEIIRADGVLCCSADSRGSNLALQEAFGRGTVTVDLGKINLGPGIYLVKVTVMDKDLIHPYAIHSNTVFHVESDKNIFDSAAVFLPEIKWKI